VNLIEEDVVVFLKNVLLVGETGAPAMGVKGNPV